MSVVEPDDDRKQMLAKLEAKLEPGRIRATLSFAGLYQITHEFIKDAVIGDLRQFHLTGFNESGFTYDEERYQTHVLNRDPKNNFRASLLWLVEARAISKAQADRLNEIYAHRHELTHELAKYIIDPAFEPDVQLFTDALEVLVAIRNFWTQIDIDTGTFEEFGSISVEDVMPGQLLLLQMCIEAYADGLVGRREGLKPEAS